MELLVVSIGVINARLTVFVTGHPLLAQNATALNFAGSLTAVLDVGHNAVVHSTSYAIKPPTVDQVLLAYMYT